MKKILLLLAILVAGCTKAAQPKMVGITINFEQTMRAPDAIAEIVASIKDAKEE